MANQHRTNSGYTLIEVLMVVSVVAVLAALVITNSDTAASDRLNSVTRIIATDLTYARSLAVANGTEYRLTFRPNNESYTLSHVGSDSSLDNLPPSPFHPQNGPAMGHQVVLEDLPHTGGNLQILGAFTVSGDGTLTRVDTITFGTLGQTFERAEETVLWLADGLDSELRYQAIRINPVTGLVTIDELTGIAPPITTPPATKEAASPPGSVS